MTLPRSEIAEKVKNNLPTSLHAVIDTRVELGWKKYGQSLDDNVKTDRQKAVHLLQELLDAMQYVEWGGLKTVGSRYVVRENLKECIQLILTENFDLTLDELGWKEGYQE